MHGVQKKKSILCSLTSLIVSLYGIYVTSRSMKKIEKIQEPALNILYPLRVKMIFRKIWRALFSYNARFEIRPFALLPTKIVNLFSCDKNYKGKQEQNCVFNPCITVERSGFKKNKHFFCLKMCYISAVLKNFSWKSSNTGQ